MYYRELTVSIPASKKSQTIPMISLKSSSGEDKYVSRRVRGVSLPFSLKNDIFSDNKSIATLK